MSFWHGEKTKVRLAERKGRVFLGVKLYFILRILGMYFNVFAEFDSLFLLLQIERPKTFVSLFVF